MPTLRTYTLGHKVFRHINDILFNFEFSRLLFWFDDDVDFTLRALLFLWLFHCHDIIERLWQSAFDISHLYSRRVTAGLSPATLRRHTPLYHNTGAHYQKFLMPAKLPKTPRAFFTTAEMFTKIEEYLDRIRTNFHIDS